jgi:predicted TPR repeat methyltransferase
VDSSSAPSKTEGRPLQRFEIRLPDAEERVDQDEEWCEVVLDGEPRRIRFHDYDEIYSVPGLYEQLFYEELRCDSPAVVREMLEGVLEVEEIDPAELRILDIGAGNGIVGEELASIGAGSITGVDIIPEAAAALERDRPGVYDAYHVIDLTDIPAEADAALAGGDFNCLTTVAALGFSDIPPAAFAGGYRYIDEGGLVVLSIKADFVSGADGSGFSEMISEAVDREILEVKATKRYTHRLSMAGDPIDYVGIIAAKRGELPGFE